MSADFKEEEDLHFFAQPYLLKPEYTESELPEMEAASAQTQPQASGKQRVMDMWWCKCGQCQAMPTEQESVCCVNWDIVMPQLERLDNSDNSADETTYRCLTEDPGFPPLISHSVLECFFHLPKVNWKQCPRPEGLGGTLSVE